MAATGHTYLVERKKGPVWYAKYRLPSGRQVQKKLGPAWAERGRPPIGYYTEKTADQALQALLADARRGLLPDPGDRSSKTFADASAEWLRYSEHDRSVALSTLRDYRRTAKTLEKAFGPETPVDRIDAARVEVYREELIYEGRLSRRTIQKMMVLLYMIFKRAKRRGWITANPAEEVERIQVQASGDFNVLEPAQVFAVARAAVNEADAALFTVAAFTGLRMGELRALRWGDIEFGNHLVFVRRNLPHGAPIDMAKAPKSGKVRSVPLIDQAAAALDKLSRRESFTEPTDLVFCSPVGTPRDDGPIRRAFYAALNGAELGHLRTKTDPITFHDLRHTFGTLGARIWPLNDLQAYMGHANIQTTMIYVHHVPKTTAAEELTRIVSGAQAAGEGVGSEAETGFSVRRENVSRTMSRTAQI